jgi:hypothetical protein
MNESNERLSTADLVDRPQRSAQEDTEMQERVEGNDARESGNGSSERAGTYGRQGGAAAQIDESQDGEISLVSEQDAQRYQERWSEIQINFVDEPQSSVQGADSLVAEVIQSLAKRFADERQRLEQQWHSGTDVSTEDLRQAMQHYRTFFKRLLAA